MYLHSYMKQDVASP